MVGCVPAAEHGAAAEGGETMSKLPRRLPYRYLVLDLHERCSRFGVPFESGTWVLFNNDKHQAKQEPLDAQVVPIVM